jgi:hypothetical protein
VRRAVAVAVVAAVVAAVLAGCGGSPAASTGPTVSPTASILPPASTGPSESSSAGAASSVAALPSDTTALAPDAVSSPLVGVVVAIDSAGLGSVSGFTLRLSGGQQVRFRVLGALEDAAAFPLGHLSEHLATAAPIRVFFRRSADLLVVYRIEDAG